MDFGTVEGDERPQQVTVGLVTANPFPLRGLQPLPGRNFLPEEAVVNGPAVLSAFCRALFTCYFLLRRCCCVTPSCNVPPKSPTTIFPAT